MSEDVAAGLLRRAGRFAITPASEPDDSLRSPALRLPRPETDPRALAGAVAAVALPPLCSFVAERLFPVASMSVNHMTAAGRQGSYPCGVIALR